MKKRSLTIGIPAYNEAANIGFLITDLLKQKTPGFDLEKIIIFSDGSTDQTESIVRNYTNKKVKLMSESSRVGIASAQNQIIKSVNSDVLIILNADVKIEDPNFITKIAIPIIENSADLVCANANGIGSEFFSGKVIESGVAFQKALYLKHKSGNNIYTCTGLSRAFSKRLYKKIYFKENIGEDAYSFLFCKSLGYTYILKKNICTYYKSPSNFNDHQRQSIRFFQSKRKYINEFGKDFVDVNYTLPRNLIIKEAFKCLFNYKLYFACYLLVLSFLRFKSILVKETQNPWNVSKSTKVLRI